MNSLSSSSLTSENVCTPSSLLSDQLLQYVDLAQRREQLHRLLSLSLYHIHDQEELNQQSYHLLLADVSSWSRFQVRIDNILHQVRL